MELAAKLPGAHAHHPNTLDRASRMVDEALPAEMALIVLVELTVDSPFSHG